MTTAQKRWGTDMNDFDNATAQVPSTVKLHGVVLPVVAARFVPGGGGLLNAHIVAYADWKGTYNVHYLVHDDDQQQSVLHQGSYDLTFAQAMVEFDRRVALNARRAS